MPELQELTIDQVPGINAGFAEAMSRVADIYHDRDGYKGDVMSVKVKCDVEVRITKIGTASVHGSVAMTEPKKKIHGKPAHISGTAVFIEPDAEDEQITLAFTNDQ